jgi:diguanylate cyclase (GGDEF)-like protein
LESTLLETNEQMRQFLNELQHRNREIALLNEMSRLLQACRTPDEAYSIIADLSKQLFPGTAGALYQFNTSCTLVSAVASWGEVPDSDRMFASEDCVALDRSLIHPLSEHQDWSRCTHLSEPLPSVTLCLPMQAQSQILGVLRLQSQNEADLDEAKRQLAHTVVEQITMALSNLKLREALREESIHDPLTGLYNRRYMEEALKQQVSRVTRRNHFLGIIMMDIDHFKRFNDTYGHSAGDALLCELGKFLQGNIRGEDVACRYGGEEFLLIMPDISLDVIQKRAEYIRQEVKQLKVNEMGQSSPPITLSLGIAIYPPHGHTIEVVLRAADQALYCAKHKGRDRVVVAESAAE